MPFHFPNPFKPSPAVKKQLLTEIAGMSQDEAVAYLAANLERVEEAIEENKREVAKMVGFPLSECEEPSNILNNSPRD
jgi:hypothetical protein